MNKFIYAIGVFLCGALAVWAYQMSEKTRQASKELAAIEAAILKEHERVSVLRAEWAVLSRPERLRHLVSLYNPQLQLVEISQVNYAEIGELPMKAGEITRPMQIDDAALTATILKYEDKYFAGGSAE